jgi:hypothetical protein
MIEQCNVYVFSCQTMVHSVIENHYDILTFFLDNMIIIDYLVSILRPLELRI